MKENKKIDIDKTIQDLTSRKLGVIRKPVAGSEKPIGNPASHANKYYDGPYHVAHRTDLWKDQSEYRTTGYFSNVRANYTLHCGPTAVTNLLLAVSKRMDNTWTGRFEEKDLFEIVASEGIRMGLYHNGAWHNLFGGTSDFLAGKYVRGALEMAGIHQARVLNATPVQTESFIRWLDDGNLAYLMLHRHECYRNHHVICNGYIKLVNEMGETITYFQIMDGWSSLPRYVDEKSLKGDFYWKIQCDI